MHPRRARLTPLLCLLSLLPTACTRTPAAPAPAPSRVAMEEGSGPVLLTGEPALKVLDDERRALLQQLGKESQTPVEWVVDARTGTVLSLSMQVAVGGEKAPDRGRKFLEQYQVLLDPRVISSEYQLSPQSAGCYESVAVFDRVVDGLPVLGSRVTVHFDDSGAITQLTNGVTSAPAKEASVDPQAIPGSVMLEELLPKGFEGELHRTKVLVPAPDLGGLFPAEVVQWAELVDPKQAEKSEQPWPESVPVAAVVVDGVAITGKLRVTGTRVSTPPQFTVYEPEYLDRDGLALPEFISYRRLGGLEVSRFPWEQNPVEMAYRFLEEHPSLMRTFEARCQYAPRALSSDPALPGVYFVRLAQKYGPLPVFGSELVLVQEGMGRVMSIAGRSLPKIEAAAAPAITPQAALDAVSTTLLDGAKQDPTQEDGVKQALSQAAKLTLGVLPAHLQDPAFRTQERLVFKVQRGQYVLYVDALTQDVLAGESLHIPANVVTDALGQSEFGWPFVRDEVDGVPTGLVTPRSFDNLPTRPGGNTGASVNAVAEFYAPLGWAGITGRGGDLVANTNVNLSTGCQNAFFDQALTQQAFFCNGFAANDMVGHEFTHGVIHHSSDLLYLDQSGAINEAYADLMGNLIFPDTTQGAWEVGELINGPRGIGFALRDMARPVFPHMATYVYRDPSLGCTVLPWSCDFGFVHSNSGIINLAHVKLADGIVEFGVQVMPGIGRAKLKLLAFLTMTRRLPADARMNDVPVATRDVCDLLVSSRARDEDGNPFTVADCDQILHAFNQVGLNGHLDSGWQEPALGYTGSRTFYNAGEQTPGNCPVTNVAGDLFSLLGTQSIDLDPTTALPTATTDVFNTQGIAFRVSPFASTPSPLGSTSMTHTIDWHNIFGSEPRYATTVASAPLCSPPFSEVERVSPGVFFDNRAFGNSGLTRIGPNPSPIDTRNCFISKTEVELLDAAGNITAGPGQSVTDRVSHCVLGVCAHFDQHAEVLSPAFWTTGDLSALIRWHYHVGRGAIRIRLRYTINQSNGVSCQP